MKLSGYKPIKCLYCSKENEATFSGRGFCSDICRLAFEKENTQQYFCFYCGFHAKKGVQSDREDDTEGLRFSANDPLCHECRMIVRDRTSCCRAGLARVILDTYERKYEKILGQVDWDEQEMKSLGYTLRTAVQKTLRDKQILEERTARLRYTAKRHSCRDYER